MRKITILIFTIIGLSLSYLNPLISHAKSPLLPTLRMGESLQTLIVQATAKLNNTLTEDQRLNPPNSQSPITTPRRAEFLSQVSSQVIGKGSKLSVNGRTFTVPWQQLQMGNSVRTLIGDGGIQQGLGVNLLSTDSLNRQPIEWFSDSGKTPIILASQLSGAYRYLDITDLAKVAGWQVQLEGDTLGLSSISTEVTNISTNPDQSGFQIVVDLNRPTPWQVSDERTSGVITLDGLANPSLIEKFKEKPPEQIEQGEEDAAPVVVVEPKNQPTVRVEGSENQTKIQVDIPEGLRLQVFSLPNPYRLVIDLHPDNMVERDILWASGIHWHQHYVNLEKERFPVVWLEVNPRAAGVILRPMWSNPTTQVGTAPLIQTAQLWQASAAINAGFFNRNTQMPLGAIRRDGKWFSGPILNRGAIAWTDSGKFKIGHLSLSETLITSNNERLPIILLNSGYVQAGISRYTSEWGASYTTLTDNEVIIAVENNQVITQESAGIAGKDSFAIPTNGYLLTLRGNDITTLANSLGIGTRVQIESNTVPAEFNNYPHILGAGPLLLQNRQIVLDAKAEKFSDAFAQQLAIRSAIGTTPSGTLIIAAIHNRAGGKGPSLTETAQLMEQMGAIDALNFDGGSSTGLYLGGSLLNRSPATAAKVHNSLGIFRPILP